MCPRSIPIALACMFLFASSPAHAQDDDVMRWGVTIWGVSYHLNDSIDYDQHNWGAGLRYYVWRHVFVEGDALRNSNRGIVLPASIGAELGIGTLFHACDVSAVAALTVAYYQNLRTQSNYIRYGPVPGVSVRCGRIQPSVIAVLSPSHTVLAALVGSLTIRF